jgi:hypothetical protein
VKRAVVLLALTTATVRPLTAQGDVTRLAGRLPAEVSAAVSALVDSARARHLPTRPLVDKALEGATKGVAPDRIVGAVHDVLGRLTRAAAAIDAGTTAAAPTGQEIEAGAFALSAGLTDSDVGDLARTAGSEQRTLVALQVAGALAALGVPRTQTVGLVRTEIQSGRSIGDLGSLTGQVQAAMAGGVPPAAAAAGLERAAAAHATPHGQGKGKGNPHRP